MSEILYGVSLIVLEELDPATQLPKVAGGVTCVGTTGKAAELSPVTSEGEEKIARSDKKILAIVRTPDLLYGYDVKLTDNTFDMNMAALIEGATIKKNVTTQAVEGYDTPLISEGDTMKPFRCTLYIANYEGDSIKNYVKFVLNKCTGKTATIKVGDDFFAPEFELKAREATKAGLPVKNVTYVEALPEQA